MNIACPVQTGPIHELRAQLRDQFPEAHRDKPPDETRECLTTGIDSLDQIGLDRREINEIICPHENGGPGLILASLLRRLKTEKQHLALIDGRDSFDPQSFGTEVCRRLLWIRCREVEKAMKAADWLVRDGNLPLIVLDFHLTSPKELRSIPSSHWHRIRGLVEKTGTTLLAFTPQKTIPSAHLRLVLERNFGLEALDLPREELEQRVSVQVSRAKHEFRRGKVDSRLSA